MCFLELLNDFSVDSVLRLEMEIALNLLSAKKCTRLLLVLCGPAAQGPLHTGSCLEIGHRLAPAFRGDCRSQV